MSGGKVVADPDKVLAILDAVQASLNELRQLFADGFTTGAVPYTPSVNIHSLNWMKKGKQPAAPGDKWAWAFAYDVDGNPVDAGLIDALKRYGKVRVGGYEVSLGGRDGKLLNRRLVE